MRGYRVGILAVTLGILSSIQSAVAEPAGRIVYAHGNAQVLDAAGIGRPARRGEQVIAGQTLLTANGRMQVQFVDGGLIAVQPNTQFRIDEYRYAGREDGSERSFFNLVKGGVRFITGAIGHKNKRNYRIQTSVATIGIRGSAGRANMCVGGSCRGRPDGLYVTGNQDTLTLRNAKGEVDIAVGQTYHVQCETCSMQEVAQAPDAYAAVEQDDDSADREDEQDASDAESAEQQGLEEITALSELNNTEFAAGELIELSDSSAAASGPLGPYVISVAGADVGSTGYAEVGFFADADGFPPSQLSGYDAKGYHVVTLGTASNYETYSNGALFIARWSNGTYIDSLDGTPTSITLGPNQGFHFAYGTSAAFPSAPTAAVAQYSFTHTTASTSASGATLGAGVTSGTVTVDFADPAIGGYPSASVSMSVQHGPGTYNVNAPNMPIIVSPASDGGLNPVFQGVGTAQNFYSSACYSACGVDVAGFLSGSKPSSIGPIPSDAGLTYTIQDSDPVHGAAGFHISTVP